jgi:murein DD-endopeptidase MepM/ murein hydrolase activator NlpD
MEKLSVFKIGLLISLISVLVTSVAATPVSYSGNGNYYDKISVSGGITWNNAKTAAENLHFLNVKGHLATITSKGENEFIISKFGTSDYYLGGFQPAGGAEPAGGWRWVTGEPWSYTNWDTSGEPNNHYYGGYTTINNDPDGTPENVLQFHYNSMWNDLPDDCLVPGYFVEYETMDWPVPGYSKVISVFHLEYGRDCVRYLGTNPHPHQGIDIQAPSGVNVIAAEDGIATIGRDPNGYGNYIRITNSDRTSTFYGLSTLYGHLSSVLVTNGKTVKKGDIIGLVGQTGHAYGPHLHFEVSKNSARVNPLDYFDRSQLTLPHAVTYGYPSGRVEHANGYVLIREIANTKVSHRYTNLNDIFAYNGERVNSGKIIADTFQ